MLTRPHSNEPQVPSLSVRQQQIMELLAEGKSNKEIASQLAIECGTVKQHLFVLFRKLNVTSRAKAAVVAGDLIKGSALKPLAKATNGSLKRLIKNTAANDQRYVWRLVCSVSVMVPEQLSTHNNNNNSHSNSHIMNRDRFLSDLRGMATQLVEALDGQISTLPYGGMLVWFGHPVAHLDDADRAAYFAQYLHQWAQSYEHHKMNISIGVSANPEMIATDAQDLYAAQSFEMAAILARHAKGLTWPLSNALLRQLAPLSVPWLELKTKKTAQNVQVEGVGAVTAIGPQAHPIPQAAERWGGLPFMDSIFDNVKAGVAQWLSVESWPAAAASSLIDTIGHLAWSKAGSEFQLVSLRTPNNQRRDRQLDSYVAQLEFAFNRLDHSIKAIHQVHHTQYASASERFVAMLLAMAEQTPLLIQVYGLKALNAFEKVIGPTGVERLASRQILIVGANVSEAGKPITSIRALGPRPNATPFSRVFTMQIPDSESLPEGIRVDLQTMLDDLSEIARDLVLSAALQLDVPISEVIDALDLPQHQLQSAIGELTALGLVAPKPTGGFEFCDIATAKALQQLQGSAITAV